MTDPIVQQADRDAAADIWRDFIARPGECVTERMMREGGGLDHGLPTYLARHRLAAQTPSPDSGACQPERDLERLVADHLRRFGYWQFDFVLGGDGGYEASYRTREGYAVMQSLDAPAPSPDFCAESAQNASDSGAVGELVERLRAYGFVHEGTSFKHPMAQRAADALAALKARADRLEAALRTFLPANLSLSNNSWPDDTPVPLDTTLGELRALSAALTPTDGSPAQ